MDCMHYFPDSLQEVCDLMVEKELRLRTPLEELDLLYENKDNIHAEADDSVPELHEGTGESLESIAESDVSTGPSMPE